MKRLLKAPVAMVLAVLARAILKKYAPQIIMVTGSVGKTSTKDALAAAFAETHFLRASEKSYNSEFGLPLTVIGARNPWENPAAWFGVFQEALALIMLPSHYPKLLILEVGADRPGDLARILRIAHPDAVVVTRLPDVPVHVEAYEGPQAVRDEEFAPAYALLPQAPLIICAEDVYARTMAARLPVSITTFGFSDDADVSIANEEFYVDGEKSGMRADVGGKKVCVEGALGRPQLYAPAAALAVAKALNISEKAVRAGLKTYVAPPGRARVLLGVRNSYIIDDSYNASPAAAEEGLNALSLIPKKGRRIAVLGDMLELGRYSQEEHARIGTLVEEKADMLIAVGLRSRATYEAARKAGLSEDTAFAVDTATDAAEILQELVQEGDVVLVKGSQSMRMERVSEALLRNPEDSQRLVRQEREWKRR
ncbi:UDP-N-acetylmuramoyl-tripeptide--D-alanyl-D-alanine ligase [Patescibacteria group bacterium]|nr:UDP-N-acetylmuramoyl-tripeptide--D-alanyl-D-alanine ligase [Patescibacteria group bacterium]MBU1500980.1 UDP-N-acetylmuramoyl-tripeptide--D-alanyl-D-alanine ligase [Patescibacteria group bacterium]MBU2080610.1 UDP-N-acetylmuramoyl-tripeptide--D-alanyl-D-alanine ligase [Patescibacteria group bacterium]MBU2124315.1 UDP-N-acetylmuramoyl-tripeptide--D-alanyl-D-alanine ligase [Patescibacteria group bacterium]MBU2194441.1 UDP-N-acetylmuramoyl-tripeptide--D-alanyl-D-alanine ligase [Patescibacteria 